MTDSNSPVDETSKEKPTGKNALEWSVFAIGLLLLLGTLGFLGREARQSTDSPPRLEAKLGEPVRAGDNVLVPVEVRNVGATTAENVEIEVEHGAQKGSFSLAFVPRRGERSGWVSFQSPVQTAKLQARVVCYEEG